MNSSEQPPPPRPSPRREVQLQGPRPTPLKVNKGSHKIRKPPVAPQPQHHYPTAGAPPHQATAPRQPVIIYAVSPKVIHTNPSDFMALVQRLTGRSPRQPPPSDVAVTDLGFPSPPPAGSLSPAANFASVERYMNESPHRQRSSNTTAIASEVTEAEMQEASVIVQPPPGILSPMPGSLPPISPGFFSPAVDPNTFSFLHELSPAFHGNRSYLENAFMASPHGFYLPTPATVPSPGSWDIFNQFHDL